MAFGIAILARMSNFGLVYEGWVATEPPHDQQADASASDQEIYFAPIRGQTRRGRTFARCLTVGYFAIQYLFAISPSSPIRQLPRRLNLVGDPMTIALARERCCDLSARSSVA
jgi:hypothetical protein